MMKKICGFIICIISIGVISAQAQELTQDDYKRAVSYMYKNYNNKTVFNLNTNINWFNDNSGVWFVDYSKETKIYKTVDFKNRKVQPLFNHQKFANALAETSKTKIEVGNISISNIEKKRKDELTFTSNEKNYRLNLKTYDVKLEEEKQRDVQNQFKSKSPDGKWIAYVKAYNLYIKSTENKKEHQLTFDGKRGYEYASWYGWDDKMEGENGNRPNHFYADWSQDSKWISTSVVDLQNAEKMYLLDWSIDSLYKPKLVSYYRGSPGDKNMVHTQPVFFNVETKKQLKVNLPKNTHINAVEIQPTGTPGVVIASYLERGFQKLNVVLVNLNTNTKTPLIKETSKTNIDNFEFRQIQATNKIVFLSERSGWRQMYIVDIKTKEITPLTKGNFYINNIEYIDEKNKVIYFLASGKESENNPYHQQLYKVNFKGELKLLTPENKHHNIDFSEDGKFFVDNYSTINIPTQTVLRESKSGKIIAKLTSADVSEVTAKGWKTPEVFELTAKDGKTTIYGAIWKPTNFDPTKSYPIIDHTYTGPHTQMFPKSFDRGFFNQSLAELGFIVMMVDGLGTSGRSKAFHNHSYKKMGDNLEDHVLAIKHLGDKYNWIDTNRVGVFGHSAGGFDTGQAMLNFPEFYKVGVASSADHDFRMEKAWWPEMYMGWPVDKSYHKVSSITKAGQLKGKLLLVHGGIDDNVNPSATFKFAEALVNADKEFDLLILPSQRHGYRGKHRSYFTKKRWNYFVEHLAGKTPIWNFKWE